MHSTNLYDEENVYYDLSDQNENVDEVLDTENIQEVDNNLNQEDEEDLSIMQNVKDLRGQKQSYIQRYLTSQLQVLEFNRDIISFEYKDNLFQGKVLHKISNNKFIFLDIQNNSKKIIDIKLI